MTTRHDHENGFTLIELLVVIIILGILSAIVVFAVRGADDKGEAAAIATDERTIRTAMETYCAAKGRYPVDPPDDPAGSGRPDAMDVLVNEKFLSDRSEHHTLHRDGTEGNCAGEHYRLEGPNSDDGGSPPRGFVGNPAAICPMPEGWCVAAPPAFSAYTNYTSNTLVQLGSGKVLAMTYGPGGEGFELFDPTVGLTGQWTAAPSPTGLDHADVKLDRMYAIGGSNCSSRCGHALVHLKSQYSDLGSWQLFDPTVLPAGAWSSEPPFSLSAATYQTNAVQIAGTSKLLVAYAKCSSDGCPPGRLEVYDPATNLFSTPVEYAAPTPKGNYQLPVMAPLHDGRVLLTAYIVYKTDPTDGLSARIFNPTNSVSPFEDATNSNLYHDVAGNPAVTLPDGSVLQVGIAPNDPDQNAAVEIYTPDLQGGKWEVISSCRQIDRGGCWILASLADGKVLANAGFDSYYRTAGGLDTFLFDPNSKTWTQTGSLNSASTAASGVLLKGGVNECGLNCGKVLTAGCAGVCTGVFPPSLTGMAELYTPPSAPPP